MADADENGWSRRTFVRSALGGAAASLVAATNREEGRTETGAPHQADAGRMSGSGLTSLSLSEAAEQVRSKKVSPVDLTRACLSRIEQLNPALNAFITITADTALA